MKLTDQKYWHLLKKHHKIPIKLGVICIVVLVLFSYAPDILVDLHKSTDQIATLADQPQRPVSSTPSASITPATKKPVAKSTPKITQQEPVVDPYIDMKPKYTFNHPDPAAETRECSGTFLTVSQGIQDFTKPQHEGFQTGDLLSLYYLGYFNRDQGTLYSWKGPGVFATSNESRVLWHSDIPGTFEIEATAMTIWGYNCKKTTAITIVSP